MRGRLAALLVTIVFFSLLWLPMLVGLIGPKASDSEEKRTLATWPSLRVISDKGVAGYQDQFEDAIKDRFGFRTFLIKSHNRLMLELFGTSGTPSVTVGKEGWLFYTNAVENFFYQNTYAQKDLAYFSRALGERQRWLAERGAQFVFMVAPNKVSVYPEQLVAAPGAQTRLGTRNMDRVLDHLREEGTLPVVDLRERFAAAKKDRRLYHRIDSHWNDFGAFLAYQELMTVIGETPLNIDEVVIREVRQEYGDLASLLNLLEAFSERVTRLNPKQRKPIKLTKRTFKTRYTPKRKEVFVNPDAPDRTVVIFGDSFFRATRVKRYVARHFRTTIVIRVDRPGDFDRDLIEEVQPALVIQEHVERFLSHPVRWRTLGGKDS